MPPLIRPSGPPNSARSFTPIAEDKDDPAHKIAHALEHIAVSLAAIDHNLETMLTSVRMIAGKGG